MVAFLPRIDELLAEHHVLSLSVCAGNEHWAASLFYVFEAARSRLLFATDPATRHGVLLERGGSTVATISRQERTVADIHGLQIEGTTHRLRHAMEGEAETLYRSRFPIPPRLTLVLWELRPEYIKATDNRVRFGHKEEWPRR
jgi:uncharacterized protein